MSIIDNTYMYSIFNTEDSSNLNWRLTEERAEEIRKDAEMKGEMRKAKEKVLNMLAANLSIDTVASIAKLSVEQVREWA